MPSAITTLHGRDDEVRALAALVASDGEALLLLGEAGTGRTALVERAARSATGTLVLSSGGSPAEVDLPGACLHRLLRPVRAEFARLAPHQAAALTELIEGRAARPEPIEPRAAGPALGVPAALLELLCLVAPVLCLIDDVDLADPVSRTALAFVARRLTGSGVAMLFTARAQPDELAGLPVRTLGPLSRAAARRILDDLPGDVAGALIGIADGNPLALHDLAAALDAEQRRGRTALPETLPPDSRLRREYRARLDRLPPPTRRLVLTVAADPEVTIGELAAAGRPDSEPADLKPADRKPADRKPGDLKPAGFEPADLEPAERAGLLRADGDRLVFRPALLGRVAYHEATRAERTAAHHRLAAVVADPLRRARHRAALATGPDDRLAAELAGYALLNDPAVAAGALEVAARLTGDPGVAAGYRIAAARLAFRAGEPWRARLLLHATRAAPAALRAEAEILAGELDLRMDDAPAPHKLVAAAVTLAGRDRARALDALLAAGDAVGLTGDYDAYPALARRAAALRRAGDPPELELPAQFLIGSAALYQGDFRRAAGPLRRVQTLAVRLDEHPALTRAGAAALLLGDDAAARSLGDRAAAHARTSGDLSTVPVAMEYAASARFALGRHDDAAAALQESADLARESGQTALAGGNLAVLAVLAAVHGDPATARLRVREARRDGVASPGGRAWAVGDWALATVDLLAGRPAEAARRLAPLMSAGHLIVRIAATPFAVEAAVRAGEYGFAAELVEFFDCWAPYTGNPDWLALSARCHALVTGDDVHFARALAEHGRGESEFERARTELLFGEQLRRRRRPIRAREHLRSALDTFQRLDCGWWAARVAAELRAAGETPARPPEQPADTLTAQQTQIAELVAGGATNREVAAKLFLSPRTVDHHLRNIFTRLGIRSRVDLARLMT